MPFVRHRAFNNREKPMSVMRVGISLILKTALALAIGLSQIANPSQLTAQYILGPGPDAPKSRTQAQPTPPPPADALRPMRRKPIDASNRVQIDAPTSPVSIGTTIELPLTIREGIVKTAIMEQRQSKPGSTFAQPIPDAFDLDSIVVHDGKRFIRVTPARLGQLDVRILMVFTDGGLTNQDVMLHVIPSLEQPTKFWFALWGQFLTPKTHVLYKSLQHPVGGKLAPTATYPDAKADLRIDDNFVQYSMRSNPGTGVIDFDPRRGAYMPTGLGHALITGSYSGVTVRLCIVVGETDDGWRRNETCSDLEP